LKKRGGAGYPSTVGSVYARTHGEEEGIVCSSKKGGVLVVISIRRGEPGKGSGKKRREGKPD